MDRGRAGRGQRRGDRLAGAQRDRGGPHRGRRAAAAGARAHAALSLSQAARPGDDARRSRQAGRPSSRALPKDLPRLISVGRLDLNTEGLLLLTNDGGLARTLELPATGWLRRYRVRAHGRVAQDQLDRLRGGVTIDGIRYGPIEATLDRAQGSNVWLTFAIREGKNREVKNVLGHLGLAVNRLIRVSFGPFQLGELAEGAIEEVKTRTLREQLGERIAGAAGADFSGADRRSRAGEAGGRRLPGARDRLAPRGDAARAPRPPSAASRMRAHRARRASSRPASRSAERKRRRERSASASPNARGRSGAAAAATPARRR